ncbi:hypothetical protein AX15_001158 [Amanita polypyramis BW_CC]|nr:hypothetical protein AX15_001158 [Amanita polypyramis BW_CC]
MSSLGDSEREDYSQPLDRTRSPRDDVDLSNAAVRQLDVRKKPKAEIKMQSERNLSIPNGISSITIYQELDTYGPPAKGPIVMVPFYIDDEDEPEDHPKDGDNAVLVLDGAKNIEGSSIGSDDVQDRKGPRGYLSKDTVSKYRLRSRDTTREMEKRVKYAEELFSELNGAVFKDKLPKDTKLTWNKRLLTTAGRAKWHRSKEGSHYTEIELSDKILDSNERIRNTLSHEMCHLATWIIDADPKQAHGRLWKRWAAKVMRKHPEIEITAREFP